MQALNVQPGTAVNASATLNIPPAQIVSIEHPCIIKNFQKGFQSLGGEQQLKHVLENDIGDGKDVEVKRGVEPVAGVSLRPDDPFAKKLSSTGVQTGNVLIKITVPKRTGRKRKRGSNEPYTVPPGLPDTRPESITSQDLLRRIQDNAESYKIEPVGVITDTHRFHTLPDFQIRTDDVPIMQELRRHIMTPSYDSLKAFDLKATKSSSTPTPFPGPPSFLPVNQSLHRQRAPTKDYDGVLSNLAAPDRHAAAAPAPQLRDLRIDHEDTEYPSRANRHLPKVEYMDTIVSNTIVPKLKAKLDARPIITRLVYWALLKGHRDTNIRRSLPYVSFYLDKGPWRNTIVKLGVDPRKDPKMRIYQTISFSKASMVAVKRGPLWDNPEKDVRTFDGTKIVEPSEMWQLCDFTHPILARLVNDSPIRDQYNDRYGWYYTGTIAKILVITRDMMVQLTTPNRKQRMTDAEYEFLAKLPDNAKTVAEYIQRAVEYEPHIQKLAEAIGDEAVSPTYMGVRGYEEVYAGKMMAELEYEVELEQGALGMEGIENGETSGRADDGDEGGNGDGYGQHVREGGDGDEAGDDEDGAQGAGHTPDGEGTNMWERRKAGLASRLNSNEADSPVTNVSESHRDDKTAQQSPAAGRNDDAVTKALDSNEANSPLAVPGEQVRDGTIIQELSTPVAAATDPRNHDPIGTHEYELVDEVNEANSPLTDVGQQDRDDTTMQQGAPSSPPATHVLFEGRRIDIHAIATQAATDTVANEAAPTPLDTSTADAAQS
jgi:general transcription factor 3C polypeptide 5 (transcription factor C subunit 1)